MTVKPLNIKEYPFNIRKDKTIYLGIQTNIISVDDRVKMSYFNTRFTPLQDFTATLYLGKIIFEKNKKGILAPKFIPSNLTDSSFEGLNTFWLNEINKKAKKPFKSLVYCSGNVCRANSSYIPYQKIHYFRHKDNIVLTKEQIISYFTQLHQENTEFIANYIESINKNHGIKAYHLHDKIYDDLLSKGILQKDMFKWWSNAPKTPYTNAMLLTLDFLSKTNQPNHKILLYDKLFYAYLVWSLREFLIPYFSGRFQDENHLLFNAGAYKEHFYNNLTNDYDDVDCNYDMSIKNPYIKKYPKVEFIPMFYPNISPLEFEFGYIEGFVNLKKFYYKERDLPKSKGYEQYSPNIDMSDFCNDKEPCSLREDIFNKITKVKPSPLGKYYFELSDNKSVYIEFFPRIYPSITNPPKGWSKEIMQKLDLRLK
ncbi:hypothetical protein [Helicobacter sp. T3_23-1059]